MISSFSKIFTSLAFSTFRTFPLSGKIACVSLSLPCFAEPPAESPSTINISESAGSFEEQSANLPGNDENSKTFLRLTKSFAFLAASLAF